MSTLTLALLFLLIALVFYFLGRWSVKPVSLKNSSIDDIIETVKRTVKPKKPTIPPGVIAFKTPEQFEAERNGDKALDDHWKESGMGEILK